MNEINEFNEKILADIFRPFNYSSRLTTIIISSESACDAEITCGNPACGSEIICNNPDFDCECNYTDPPIHVEADIYMRYENCPHKNSYWQCIDCEIFFCPECDEEKYGFILSDNECCILCLAINYQRNKYNPIPDINQKILSDTLFREYWEGL
jgi:hypothetical protein